MGILDSQQECLDGLDAHYANAHAKIFSCLGKESEAYTHYLASELYPCLYDIMWAIGELRTAVTYLAYQSSGNPRNADILYYLEYYTAVTYKAICEAWGANDFEGRAVTIAFIDRMRQLLWDEPYSATWAAKPEGYEE